MFRISLPTSFFMGAALLLALTTARAQTGSVGINTDGSTADASAMLDVKSTTQGVLVPRMTAQQRGLIGSPSTGLLVYQTDASAGFYFYNGTAWTSLGGSGTTGPPGPAGQGVPVGGTTGQVLSKINATDYNTQWTTPSAGDGGASTQLIATLAATVTLPISSSLTTPDVIPFDNVTTSPTLGNTWTGNNKFTVGANGAGTYLITVQVVGDNNVGAVPMIEMNGTGNSGSGFYGVYYSNTNALQNPIKHRGHVSAVRKMAAGDYFQIRAASASTVIGPTLNANGSTNISVVKLN